MPELTSAAVESETPVNPYSLLAAVNESSNTAHGAWLIFLGLMTYLMVAVAGVTHADLLRETPVSLPILQVSIQLSQFFQFAPVILVLLHLGLVSQLSLLAKKTLEFDHALRLLEATDRRTHPLRLELDNFFFVQAIAGPERSTIMSGFLHGMSWLTLVVLPVVLILYIQAVFLPYHDVAITWSHRVALLVDILMLALIGVFLMRAETSFPRAFARTTTAHPIRFTLTVGVLGLITLFSLFVATIPGEAIDRMGREAAGLRGDDGEGPRDSRIRGGTWLGFLGGHADGRLLGLFSRNLVVTDTDLVADKDVTEGEPTLKLRGRDLRFARLDRSDLHQADLTGADVSGASFVGADLRGIWLQCADVNELLLTDDRARAQCATARRADFSRARLEKAQMVGIDLRGARLEETRLVEAEMPYALLTGTNFSSARLEKADLTGGVQAQGANFLIASLQGADLTGAQLQFADFSSAGMQGATLDYAAMQGAVLRDADLEAASLQQAKLYAADMSGTKLQASDMRYASVWLTAPPPDSGMARADLSNLALAAPSEDDLAALKRAVERIEQPATRRLVQEAVQSLFDADASQRWAGSPDAKRWQGMMSEAIAGASDPGYPAALTSYLGAAMCRPRWSQGALATGVARRATQGVFRGDMQAIYDRLHAGGDCAAGKAVGDKAMRALSTAVDTARSGGN